MFTSNPFADLTVFLSPLVMQVYLVLMILAVAIGTLVDMLHKRSAEFFIRQWKRSRCEAERPLSGLDHAALAARTFLKEVVTSGEFCNPRRRISHLLMFYGFLSYLITTIVMVFGYPTPATPAPAILPLLWNIGALMVLTGGYWFFFFLRVDVAKEGHSPFRLVRADLFIVTLLASVSFALIWEIVQATGNLTATQVVFGIYILFTTLLFGSVPWSKFAHMFYKPAAALQKRVAEANGSSNLPTPANVRKLGS
ncbi:adenylyl-sulfate reductase [Sedimenticola hydrogenitrophicus]|uniref:adenylyl-sulfate reductase n=1 Tax=Sedimenticola hydrogenitrophicus TaxID=2967975 RepID=UPI0023AEEC0F|nr:adenylyl-sulfate reductase [Sedimenticola hydrogenitrophicus]